MIEKLRSLVDELGWVDAIIYIIDRALGTIKAPVSIARYVLVAQAVPDKPMLPPKRGSSIVVRPLKLADDLGSETTLSPALFARRTACGSITFGAFDASGLIGYLSIDLGPHDDEFLPARFVPLPTSLCAWDYDFFVTARLRLGVVYLRIWDSVFEFLRNRGVAWSFSYIASANVRSMKSQLRMGAIPVETFIVARLGRCQVFLRARPPFIQIAGLSGCRPEIATVAPQR